MEDVVREVEGRFKVSIADSTMIWLVQQAMDRAHEKLKSRDGIITRLSEISKFYELAVMQLDGCLRFVQEETGSYILESDHEEVLLDLREIRDRLQTRLRQTELTIFEVDRELGERSENELRLKQMLELKENELVSLKENLKRTRNEGVEEYRKSNLEGTNEDTDGEISELKNSVDQQMMSIRQKLEPEYIAGEEFLSGVDNNKMEKMDGDIDVLKGTLDLAFSKMHNAVFLSEMGPIEQSWRWTLEKEVVAILIRGLLKEFRVKDTRPEKKASLGTPVHLDITNEVLFICHELEGLANENGYNETSTGLAAKSSSVGNNYEMKMAKDHCEEPSLTQQETLDGHKRIVCNKSTIENVISRLENLINLNTKLNKEEFSGNGDATSKEACGAKGFSDSEGSNAEIVSRYSLNEASAIVRNLRSVSDQDKEATMVRQEKEEAELQAVIVEDTYMTLFKGLISDFYIELQAHSIWSLITQDMSENLIKEMVKERDETRANRKIKANIREDVHSLVLTEAVRDLSFSRAAKFDDCYNCLEKHLKENVDITFFREMLKDWNKSAERYQEECRCRQDLDWIVIKEMIMERDETTENEKIKADLREDVYSVVLNDAAKDLGFSGAAKSEDCSNCLKKYVIENVNFTIFRETLKDWNKSADRHHEVDRCRQDLDSIALKEMVKETVETMEIEKIKADIREDVYSLVLSNAVKDLSRAAKFEDCSNCLENHLEEYVNFTFFREMLKDWNKSADRHHEEGHCRQEDLDWIVFKELIKERDQITENKKITADRRDDYSLILSNPAKDPGFLNAAKFEDCSNCLEKHLKENVNLTFSREMLKDWNKSAERHYEESRCGQHLDWFVLKEILKISLSSLAYNQSQLIDQQVAAKEMSLLQSFITSCNQFTGAMQDFEFRVLKKIEKTTFRVDNIQTELHSLSKQIVSLRRKESVYRKAFVLRCENLQKAENEVDLLGDQVDALLELLQRTDQTLWRHQVVLHQNSEISDISILIKKELSGCLPCQE